MKNEAIIEDHAQEFRIDHISKSPNTPIFFKGDYFGSWIKGRYCVDSVRRAHMSETRNLVQYHCVYWFIESLFQHLTM